MMQSLHVSIPRAAEWLINLLQIVTVRIARACKNEDGPTVGPSREECSVAHLAHRGSRRTCPGKREGGRWSASGRFVWPSKQRL